MTSNFDKHIYEHLRQVRENKPLVYNLTNTVVSNFVANGLLAIGASPIMADEKQEIEEIVSISDSLSVNFGTLNCAQIESIILAVNYASKKGIPIVIDPVGAGASRIRTSTPLEILRHSRRTILKGNSSEIVVLAGSNIKSRGVDSCMDSVDAIESAKYLLQKYALELVIISGEHDYIVSNFCILKCSNGTRLMSNVTGTGCLLGSVIAAFVAVSRDNIFAAKSAICCYNIAAELASEHCLGPGSFIPHFIDSLYAIDSKTIQEMMRVENV